MKLVNRFEILQILDQGGYGITYRAIDHHQPSQPECVIKELIHTNPKILEMFQQEARTLEKIGRHSHIPQLLAYFDEGNRFYIAQELIQGHNLSQEIREGKPLDEGYVTKLLKDILRVLAFVHQHRMIHRDIKPANLIRQTSNGDIFLIDFGVVKELSHSQIDGNGQMTATVNVGTAGYIAPEQARGKLCYASDLYSVGMVAIAVLMDVPPQRLPVHPLTQQVQWSNGNISPSLETFIKRLIEPNPNNRYPNAREALKGLEQILTGIQLRQDSDLPTHVAAKAPRYTDTTPTKPVTLIPSSLILKVMGFITVALVMVGFGVKGYQWTARALNDRWDAVKAATTPQGGAAKSRELVDLLEDGSIQTRPEVVEAFWEMVAAAEAEGVELIPLAGYMSLADQRKALPKDTGINLQQWLKQSDYHTGYAIAMGDKNAEESTDWDPSFAQTDGYRWLKRYAKNYGFELSYPQGNPAGEQEPWHWRYTRGTQF
ncbi:protein kinase domain-containing protein [Leptothoe sp. PORK10 BA2]|uniref:protein kinase domain-containing protein n=1 Tax=Leptothoe sp. PORK10 BA2 TaxID=3110254 RepID=UPI002B1FF7AE|nr:D-alanyl-D-alanine carboxypeptidase family protein [Leptothoe sp. PORK10 BA2]MEA5465441.1 D-alanyl-D-alanine carboxypeptidase family protein [Leptothoe sp. PORK10 BA2]